MQQSLKLFSLLLCLLAFTQTAYGYIDPGTGSYIIQIFIAAFATILYAVKYFWRNIKDFFTRFTSKPTPKTKKTTTHRPATKMKWIKSTCGKNPAQPAQQTKPATRGIKAATKDELKITPAVVKTPDKHKVD